MCDTAGAKECTKLFTAELVKSAVKKLKADKADVTGQFTSDCLKSANFQAFLTHDYICQDLIVCTLYLIV